MSFNELELLRSPLAAAVVRYACVVAACGSIQTGSS